MRTFPCLVAGLLLVAAPCAQAADKPLLPAPDKKAASAPYDWTGFYAGVNTGYARSDSKWSAGPSESGSRSFGNAATFGAHAGYNYQLNNGVLFGTESDLSRTP